MKPHSCRKPWSLWVYHIATPASKIAIDANPASSISQFGEGANDILIVASHLIVAVNLCLFKSTSSSAQCRVSGTDVVCKPVLICNAVILAAFITIMAVMNTLPIFRVAAFTHRAALVALQLLCSTFLWSIILVEEIVNQSLHEPHERCPLDDAILCSENAIFVFGNFVECLLSQTLMMLGHPSSIPFQRRRTKALHPLNSNDKQSACLGVNSILAIDQSANGANHRHHNADSTNPGASHIEERRSHHHQSMEARIDIFNDVGQLHKEQLDEIVQLHEGKLEQVHSHAIHQRPIYPRHVHERKRRATAQGVRRCKGTCNNQSDQVCTNLRSLKTSWSTSNFVWILSFHPHLVQQDCMFHCHLHPNCAWGMS